MFPGQCGNTAFFFKSQPDQFHFEFRGIVFPGKSFFSAHEVSTCKISGCLSYRILDSGPDGTQTTLTLIGIIDKHLSQNSGEYLLAQSNNIIRKDGKRGPWYSQKFTRLRDSTLSTATDRQCFHSLRGMFITCLDRAGVPEQRIGAITGHTEQKAKTEAFRTYSKGAGMRELAEYVECVYYHAL